MCARRSLAEERRGRRTGERGYSGGSTTFVTRVYVVAEGPTERSFLREVLAPALWSSEVYLTPVLLGPPGHKGGNTSYVRVRRAVMAQLKQDRTAYCSTM